MPQLPWYVWIAGTLAAYAVVSAALDFACRTLFAARRICGDERVAARLPRWKLLALFLVNTAQIGGALALVDGLYAHGHTGLYSRAMVSLVDVPIVAAEVLLILLVLDTNFFWFHRLMHRFRRVFATFHAEHHRPRFPDVWHLQYQHPVDYFLTTAAPVAWVALLPVPLAVTSFLLAVTIASFLNIAGHCGHEVSNTVIGLPTPNGWAACIDPRRRWVARLFNNVVHHDLHHQKFRYNYSLYFTLWDRLCGTCHPDTDRVDAYVSAGSVSSLAGQHRRSRP